MTTIRKKVLAVLENRGAEDHITATDARRIVGVLLDELKAAGLPVDETEPFVDMERLRGTVEGPTAEREVLEAIGTSAPEETAKKAPPEEETTEETTEPAPAHGFTTPQD